MVLTSDKSDSEYYFQYLMTKLNKLGSRKDIEVIVSALESIPVSYASLNCLFLSHSLNSSVLLGLNLEKSSYLVKSSYSKIALSILMTVESRQPPAPLSHLKNFLFYILQ